MSLAKPFQTTRLSLNPLTEADAAAIHPIYAHSEGMRFMDEPPHADLETTRAMIARQSVQDACYWTVRLREDEERPIGVVGFLGGIPVAGFGYIFHPDFWGQGYATEAVRGGLNFGFDVLGCRRVELWIDSRNRASRRLAERLGFVARSSLTQKYAHRERAHEMLVYGQTKEEWRGIPANRPVTHATGLDVVLGVHDVVETVDYYRDVLGFRVTFLYGEPPTHAGVTNGLWTQTGAVLQITRIPPERVSGGAVALYIRVGPDIDALHQRYAASGVDIVEPPASHPWGMREFAIRDLNGYLLRFATPA